jgi:hypothetical protein
MTSLTYVNECFHDFMFVNGAPNLASQGLLPTSPQPSVGRRPWLARLWSPPCKFSSAALVQSLAKSLLHYFVDYSYYSSPIHGLFVLFVDYSRTIRTIRRLFVLFVDYSYYSSTIRGLFVLFVDYSRTIRTIRRLFALFASLF